MLKYNWRKIILDAVKDEKVSKNEKDDVLLEEVCAKILREGKLKYTYDRQGNLGMVFFISDLFYFIFWKKKFELI